MKTFLKFLISKNRIDTVASIYISIELAYLENQNWHEAQAIMRILQELTLKPEEEQVFLYLKDIVLNQNEKERIELIRYLSE